MELKLGEDIVKTAKGIMLLSKNIGELSMTKFQRHGNALYVT